MISQPGRDLAPIAALHLYLHGAESEARGNGVRGGVAETSNLEGLVQVGCGCYEAGQRPADPTSRVLEEPPAA